MSALSLQLPSTASMTPSRLLHAYWSEARMELVRTLRNPAFVFPTIALPVLLYVFFGVVLAKGGPDAPPPGIALKVLSGFAMFSAIGPGMFGMGIGFAMEREHGTFTLKRALPMPPAANLIAKVLTSGVLALIAMAMLIFCAIQWAHVDLTAGQVARFVLVGALGVMPFCAFGLMIASFVSGQAAPAIVNLIYFPMIYLSGLFPFPMPAALQTAAAFWPAFHLNQLSLAALGLKVALSPWVAASVLGVFTIVCVIVAARRLAHEG
jgi:ABC-2 type transport system permease protein